MATTKVRYANSGGSNVRSSAAGSVVTTVNQGNLMYDIPGEKTVTKALNGTTYTWVRVYYYKINSDNSTTEGNGWVAMSTTTEVSTTVPSKSAIISAATALEQNQMLTNARYIYNYLIGKKWSKNAICGMLGNMEMESTINPGRWQNGKVNTANGYGLTQWTPSTKYTNWLGSGKTSGDIDNQLERILYEVSHESEQWVSGNYSPSMSFADFTKSTSSTTALAECFLKCYEQPADQSSTVINKRKANASKWSTLIGFLVS
ncbi:phage tail tip lysozyme [Lacrimispora sp.]|uniref:phage tail tip lysozyme n=1 Tax=Lacrimispora sp. TaxID=2719234 RepID=UPI00289C5302|nr:phage tail tip lysozyme [Lacrimispora sp.]